MVQIFYCVPVEWSGGTYWYWAVDTNIQCYSSSHKILMVFGGGPLVIVGLGFPAIVFWRVYRRRDCLHTPMVVSRYGYFYQSYYAGLAYWASFVHLRKGLLAIVSVLSLTFSDQLKENLALLILVLATTLHTHCKPYKEQKLNRMETASLVISSIMILLEGITRSPEVNHNVDTAVSVAIFMLLAVFVVYMVMELLMAYKKSTHNWVKDQEEYNEHTGGLNSLCKVLVQILSSRSRTVITIVQEKIKLRTRCLVENQVPCGGIESLGAEEGGSSLPMSNGILPQ